MRLFFGIEVPAFTAVSIRDWRDTQTLCDGRPVPAANFHITLAFVGELSDSRLEMLCEKADQLGAGEMRTTAHGDRIAAQTLLLNQVGYWPRPGIFWLGPDNWPSAMNQLASALNNIGVAAGGKRSKSTYQPHITLFRACQTPPPPPLSAPAISMAYSAFSLFESVRGKHGMHYSNLCDFPLH